MKVTSCCQRRSQARDRPLCGGARPGGRRRQAPAVMEIMPRYESPAAWLHCSTMRTGSVPARLWSRTLAALDECGLGHSRPSVSTPTAGAADAEDANRAAGGLT